jgi:hypothetical protein
MPNGTSDLSVLSSIGETEKSRLSHFVYGQSFPCAKGSVRWCVVVKLQPVLSLPKFGTKSLQIFMQWFHEWLACEDEFFVNNGLDDKENDEHALDFFSLQLSRLFQCRWVWTFLLQLMLSSPNACLIISRVSVPHFPRYVQKLMLFLCWIHPEIASGQIHES